MIVPRKVTVNGTTYAVTEIAANAMQNNTSMATVTIGDNITSIGKNAFTGAEKLKRVTIKGNVTSVGQGAFNGINKKAVIKIQASESDYQKLVKRIKRSGVADTVTFQQI